MIKELKFIFYVVVICIFLFFCLRYYLSDDYKKETFRTIKLINDQVFLGDNEINSLPSDTENIIQYVDKNLNEKKEYKFWKLLKKN